MRGRVLAGMALALAAAPGAARAAEPVTVSAGSLRALVTPDPWHVELRDGSGRVLSEVGGPGSGPTGTLGFRAGGSWFHATRVIADERAGESYAATVATNDPLGRRLLVRIAPDAEGVVRLVASVAGDASATGIAFDSRPGERFLGFGERSNAVDQRGHEVESYVSDGPYPRTEKPFEVSLIPPPGVRMRDDSTYFPIPWLL